MKFNLKNTPKYGNLIVEFYGLNDVKDLGDLFAVFGTKNHFDSEYLYKGEAKDCTIYKEKIKILNKKCSRLGFVKIKRYNK